MTPELQKYYEDRFSMMGHPGWASFCEQVKEMLEATNDLSACKDAETLFYRKGEVSIMKWILSLQDSFSRAYKDLQNEDSNNEDA